MFQACFQSVRDDPGADRNAGAREGGKVLRAIPSTGGWHNVDSGLSVAAATDAGAVCQDWWGIVRVGTVGGGVFTATNQSNQWWENGASRHGGCRCAAGCLHHKLFSGDHGEDCSASITAAEYKCSDIDGGGFHRSEL